jgi:hypothetical protein
LAVEFPVLRMAGGRDLSALAAIYTAPTGASRSTRARFAEEFARVASCDARVS